MDITALQDIVQHLPDIAHQFAAAAGHVVEYAQPVTRVFGNVAHAFSPGSNLSYAEKIYHGGKLTILNSLAVFCLVTGNAEGFVGTMVGNVDEIRSLSSIGEASHAGPQPHRKFRL